MQRRRRSLRARRFLTDGLHADGGGAPRADRTADGTARVINGPAGACAACAERSATTRVSSVNCRARPNGASTRTNSVSHDSNTGQSPNGKPDTRNRHTRARGGGSGHRGDPPRNSGGYRHKGRERALTERLRSFECRHRRRRYADRKAIRHDLERRPARTETTIVRAHARVSAGKPALTRSGPISAGVPACVQHDGPTPRPTRRSTRCGALHGRGFSPRSARAPS